MGRVAGVVLSMVMAAGAVQAQTTEAPIQPNNAAITLTLGGGESLVIVAWPYKAGGNLAVCGLHFPETGRSITKTTRNNLLRTMIVALNGKPLSVQPMNFTVYPDEETAIARRTGACTVTNIPWQDAYAKTTLEVYGRRGFIRQ